MPTAVLLGAEREWKVNKGQLKLEEVRHYGYVVDLSSLKVCFCFCKVDCFISCTYVRCAVIVFLLSC